MESIDCVNGQYPATQSLDSIKVVGSSGRLLGLNLPGVRDWGL
ncbi:MAG TPA: hypothetical protein ACFYEA_00465 [Candidatus Tripitaka californicus]